jgi:hypothetical protein
VAVAGSNAAELLELIEEAFDEVALAVDGFFPTELRLPMGAIGDVWNGTLRPEMRANAIGIVSAEEHDRRLAGKNPAQ